MTEPDFDEKAERLRAKTRDRDPGGLPRPHGSPPKQGKFCSKCYDMSHRVIGPKCVCGRLYERLPKLKIEPWQQPEPLVFD